MLRDKKIIPLILIFIPIVTVIWSLILNHLSGPYFISRIDPEYVYLLNGMNVALLEFDRIGHVDHPGTPFQLITGVFIRVIYWISGSGSLTDDVISEPEKYLSWSSFFLSLITAWLIYWISNLEYKRSKNLFGALIIPVSLFFFTVIVDLPSRYIPDRLLMMNLLVFTGFCMKYFYLGYSPKKFAIVSGILMALGLVTKINFIPFLILPLFVIPNLRRILLYCISLVLSSVILFVPVYDKFTAFRRFAVQILTHDSLYGSGSKQMVNVETFRDNLLLIIKNNPAFVFILAIAIVFLISLLFKISTRKNYKTELFFFIGFLIVAVFNTFLVAKHYKNYYMIPIFSISGLVLYVAWVIGSRSQFRRYIQYVIIIAAFVFIGFVIKILVPGYQKRNFLLHQEILAHSFIRKNISPNDFFFIEPTWMAGPLIANGLVYGNSYIARRIYFYNDYEKRYPNVLTYEGLDKPMKYNRMVDADNESILKSGKNVFVLSTPGRNAALLCNYLDSCAQLYHINLSCDTVFKNDVLNSQILRIQNTSGWKISDRANCGFERGRNNSIYTDDEQTRLYGSYTLTHKFTSNGFYACELDNRLGQSPKYVINNVCKGDYLQVTVKRKREDGRDKGRLVVTYMGSESGQVIKAEEKKVSTINSRWELVRLSFTLFDQPADSTLTCFYEYNGDESYVIDDFGFKLFTK